MSETFDKLLENRDYWRDEAKASWANIEALEAENHELRWAKRQEDDQEAQDLEKYNQRFFDPDSLKSGLSVELEGTASNEVFDLIIGKQPEQELREITMVASVLCRCVWRVVDHFLAAVRDVSACCKVALSARDVLVRIGQHLVRYVHFGASHGRRRKLTL